jgi:hypothetical protein
MAPEFLSVEIKSRQFQPTLAKMVFPFQQITNLTKEFFDKLSDKLEELNLPGIEFAERYLPHLRLIGVLVETGSLAPASRSSSFTSRRLFLEAMFKAVLPSFVFALTSAPLPTAPPLLLCGRFEIRSSKR